MKEAPRPLATDLRIGGFDHHQISRDGDIAIYSQAKAGRIYNYEVIIIRAHFGRVIRGTPIPAAEYYPSPECWGKYGWTCPTLEKAQEQAAELAAHAPVHSRALKRGRYDDREPENAHQELQEA